MTCSLNHSTFPPMIVAIFVTLVGCGLAEDRAELSADDAAILNAAMDYLAADDFTLRCAETDRPFDKPGNILLQDRTLAWRVDDGGWNSLLVGLEEMFFDLKGRKAAGETLTEEQWQTLESGAASRQPSLKIQLTPHSTRWSIVDADLFTNAAALDKEPFWNAIQRKLPDMLLVICLSAPQRSNSGKVAFVDVVVTGSHGYSKGLFLFLTRDDDRWRVEKNLHTWIE